MFVSAEVVTDYGRCRLTPKLSCAYKASLYSCTFFAELSWLFLSDAAKLQKAFSQFSSKW